MKDDTTLYEMWLWIDVVATYAFFKIGTRKRRRFALRQNFPDDAQWASRVKKYFLAFLVTKCVRVYLKRGIVAL